MAWMPPVLPEMDAVLVWQRGGASFFGSPDLLWPNDFGAIFTGEISGMGELGNAFNKAKRVTAFFPGILKNAGDRTGLNRPQKLLASGMISAPAGHGHLHAEIVEFEPVV